jgi:hypothetical protein
MIFKSTDSILEHVTPKLEPVAPVFPSHAASLLTARRLAAVLHQSQEAKNACAEFYVK